MSPTISSVFSTSSVLAACVVFAAFLYGDTEIDDSSYESLFRSAYKSELQGLSAYPRPQTLEALVRFDQVDLIFEVLPPYKKDSSESEWEQSKSRNIVQTPIIAVAEQLFRAGRIDEGVALLEKMLPPQKEGGDMLRVGYVSEALLEQKRFDLAWKTADCGSPREKAENVSRMIHRLIAKTRYEKEPFHPSHTPKPSPWQAREEDNPIYRKEAENGLARLKEIYAAMENEREKEWVMKNDIASSLAVLGRYDDAYEIARNDPRSRFNILSEIVQDCFQCDDRDALERWFKLFRESFERNEYGMGIDYDGRMHYVWPCIRIGKYSDALDVIEKNPPPRGQSGVGGSGTYMFRAYEDIAQKNVETGFRYNSAELVARLLSYHKKTKEADEKGKRKNVVTFNDYTSDKFSFNILKARLDLGQIDAALESLEQIHGAIDSYNAMSDIAVYCIKNRSPEEAGRVEKRILSIFSANPGVNRNNMVEWYTVDYLAETAARLLADGHVEAGNRYLERAVEQSEICHRRSEKEENATFDSSSNLGTVCQKLIAHGLADEAASLVERFADRYTMAETRLAITRKYAAQNEMEKMKQSLRKTVDAYSKTKHFFPPQFNRDYGAMASLAVLCDEKDLFYRILGEGLKFGDKYRWFDTDVFTSEAIDAYARGLAKYGDKNHELFAGAEKIGDAFKGAGYRSEIYFSLGVARSMLGDHVDARRLLKKGIESRRQDEFKSIKSSCVPIIEASFFSKK